MVRARKMEIIGGMHHGLNRGEWNRENISGRVSLTLDF